MRNSLWRVILKDLVPSPSGRKSPLGQGSLSLPDFKRYNDARRLLVHICQGVLFG